MIKKIAVVTGANRGLAKAIQADNTLKLPIYWRLPLLRDIPVQLMAFGVFPLHVKTKFRLQDADFDAAEKSSERAFIK